MPAKKNSTIKKDTNSSADKNISIGRDVVDSAVIVGDNNTTTFQKIINIFRSGSESLDQQNRRVMLNHVEAFWVKGILEKSLHGVALLDLGIEEDVTAVNYPWAIKRESTNETLSAGKPMLEIFNDIGLGRSLLILGAPGSGKTTMLLELTRQLIERARIDEAEPIPVVFNLASWTEKQALADWLVEQLNNVYAVPKKTAPIWVSENKMLLLLDGLDEVRGESREKCVEAINQFRNENGLTSLVISSRIEEYAVINAKLKFEGAIKLQPLTFEQANAYFSRFGKSLAGVKNLLKKDESLHELAETPLMLSIMTLAYKDKSAKELNSLKGKDTQRRHLFDTYIERMFERPTRKTSSSFTKQYTLHYLSSLARKMIQHNLITYQIEAIQPSWLEDEKQRQSYRRFFRWSMGLVFGLIIGMFGGVRFGPFGGLIFGLIFGLGFMQIFGQSVKTDSEIQMMDKLRWSWANVRKPIGKPIAILILGLGFGLFFMLLFMQRFGLFGSLILGLGFGLFLGLVEGFSSVQVGEVSYPGQRIKQTLFSGIIKSLIIGLIMGLIIGMLNWTNFGLGFGLIMGLIIGMFGGVFGGLDALIQYFILRNLLIKNGVLPRQLVPFLEHAVDLIFMRRVGGSYIFVHRLLMEHFAEMEI